MLSSASRVVLGIVTVAALAASAAVVRGDRDGDAEGLAKACAGLPTHSQLDYTLFNLRAQSNGGFDPICGPLAQLDSEALARQRTAHLDRRPSP